MFEDSMGDALETDFSAELFNDRIDFGRDPFLFETSQWLDPNLNPTDVFSDAHFEEQMREARQIKFSYRDIKRSIEEILDFGFNR